jgi:anti-sigma regulatory factor (Ser/Thr protein kinase)
VTPMPGTSAGRLVLRNDLSELRRLAGWIEIWTQQSVLSPDMSFAVALCLEEAVANVIMHGGSEDERLEIAVEVECDGPALIVRVEDNGRHFDPTTAPPSSSSPASLEEAKIGDVGIQLMRRLASSMHYERHDRRNRLTLRFLERDARAARQG